MPSLGLRVPEEANGQRRRQPEQRRAEESAEGARPDGRGHFRARGQGQERIHLARRVLWTEARGVVNL